MERRIELSHPAIAEFGEFLMRVRDEAIDDWDMILDGRMKSPRALQLRTRFAAFDEAQLATVRETIRDVVDTVLHQLLFAIEQNEDIDVSVTIEDSTYNKISDISDGLAGELYGESGWIAKYSQK